MSDNDANGEMDARELGNNQFKKRQFTKGRWTPSTLHE
jgi:hypothetical protein